MKTAIAAIAGSLGLSMLKKMNKGSKATTEINIQMKEAFSMEFSWIARTDFDHIPWDDEYDRYDEEAFDEFVESIANDELAKGLVGGTYTDGTCSLTVYEALVSIYDVYVHKHEIQFYVTLKGYGNNLIEIDENGEKLRTLIDLEYFANIVGIFDNVEDTVKENGIWNEATYEMRREWFLGETNVKSILNLPDTRKKYTLRNT